MALLQAVAVVLLSPILLPAYILLVDPPDPEDAPKPKSKPWLPASLVHVVFHMVALFALMKAAEALCGFTGPAWAEAAANTLLGNGRVGEVLTACSFLAVPRSPTMQLCTIFAIYCYYRCAYHFEAWHAARYPLQLFSEEEGGEEGPDGRLNALARQEAARSTRRVFNPRFRALLTVAMFIGGPNKLLVNCMISTLARFGIIVV